VTTDGRTTKARVHLDHAVENIERALAVLERMRENDITPAGAFTAASFLQSAGTHVSFVEEFAVDRQAA
jgi:hypothetical protein